jgi:hypothetical protein
VTGAPRSASEYGCMVALGTWVLECLTITIAALATTGTIDWATAWLLLIALPITLGTSAIAGIGGVILFRTWISPRGATTSTPPTDPFTSERE